MATAMIGNVRLRTVLHDRFDPICIQLLTQLPTLVEGGRPKASKVYGRRDNSIA